MQEILVIEPTEDRSIPIGSTKSTIMVHSTETGGRYSLIEHALPPQTSGQPLHVHQHYSHAWYILAGKIELTCGKKIIQAGAGTFVFVPRGTNHSLRNSGNEPARILEIDSPGGLEHYYQELSSAFLEGTPVDTSAVAALQHKYDTYLITK
jgi:mannose-6-phosphate isomerase-like protein (cupin superfamily)